MATTCKNMCQLTGDLYPRPYVIVVVVVVVLVHMRSFNEFSCWKERMSYSSCLRCVYIQLCDVGSDFLHFFFFFAVVLLATRP